MTALTGSNPWGTNLSMFYSHFFFQVAVPYANTRVVETHLAYSHTDQARPV